MNYVEKAVKISTAPENCESDNWSDWISLCDDADDEIKQLKADKEILVFCNKGLVVKADKLQTELEESKHVKKHIIETFRQHIKNKWNWSDEDVLEIIRKSVINDEDYEALKGG